MCLTLFQFNFPHLKLARFQLQFKLFMNWNQEIGRIKQTLNTLRERIMNCERNINKHIPENYTESSGETCLRVRQAQVWRELERRAHVWGGLERRAQIQRELEQQRLGYVWEIERKIEASEAVQIDLGDGVQIRGREVEGNGKRFSKMRSELESGE